MVRLALAGSVRGWRYSRLGLTLTLTRQALLALYDAHGPEAAELSAGDHPSELSAGDHPSELSAGDHPCELSAGDHPSEPEANAASAALQGAASASAGLQPSYSVGRRWLQVGHAWLERGAGQLPETAPLQVGLGLGFA